MFALGMSDDKRARLIGLTRLAVKNFNAGDWEALGAYTGATEVINNHDRLLRSLSFNDPDYSGNAHGVIFSIAERNPRNIEIIEHYITEHYGEPEPFSFLPGEDISTAPSKNRKVVFTPSVFELPAGGLEPDLIAVMTPFASQFEPVFDAINGAAFMTGFRTLRAKDIWEHSAVIQDVFSLIFRAKIVVCDFTGKNPNVFYEAGIAHTLGKHVVPITQNADDIPFDLRHHRYLAYLGNKEGIGVLGTELAKKFATLR